MKALTLTDLEGFDLFDQNGNEISLAVLQGEFWGDDYQLDNSAYTLVKGNRQPYDPKWSEDCLIFVLTPLDKQGREKSLEELVIYARQ